MTVITAIHITPEITSRGKWECPLCEARGWGREWWIRHRLERHVDCPDCSRWFTERGLAHHQHKCKNRG